MQPKKYYLRNSGTCLVGRLNHSKGAPLQKKKWVPHDIQSLLVRNPRNTWCRSHRGSVFHLARFDGCQGRKRRQIRNVASGPSRSLPAPSTACDAQAGALPYGPEYGFLSHVPANAIRMPGYTFVPGVGILGASCDLPTSACSNQYRDIQ
jgi:hypothetical protein